MTTAAVQKKFAVSSLVLHGQQWLCVRPEVAHNNFSSPDRAPTCWRRVVAGRFHFGGASRPQLRWSTTASWVGDSVTAARGTLSTTSRALKGTDGQHAGAIALLKRVFGSRSTASRVPTQRDLSVTKQHRNDRWDRCTASTGYWLIITTASQDRPISVFSCIIQQPNMARACTHRRWIALAPSFAAIPQLGSCDIR